MSSFQSFANVRPLSSQWIPIKLTYIPTSFNSPLHFNPTPTFLGITFNRILSFSKHVSLLKAKFFPCLDALCCISVSSWGPFKKSPLFCTKLIFGSSSLMLHLNGFLSSALPTLPSENAFTKQLVTPSLAASHPPLFHISLRRLFLLYQQP